MWGLWCEKAGREASTVVPGTPVLKPDDQRGREKRFRWPSGVNLFQRHQTEPNWMDGSSSENSATECRTGLEDGPSAALMGELAQAGVTHGRAD